MKFIKYVGKGTGPNIASSLLTGQYDFSANVIQEMTDADAETLIKRCGHSFRNVTDASLVSYAVTRTADTTKPVLASAAVNGKILLLTYTEAGSQINPYDTAAAGDFAVVNAGAANVVKTVTVVGKAVMLQLTNICVHGATVTVGYTQQVTGAKQIKDLKGNKADNLVAQAVTVSTPDIAPPVLASATVDGDSLVLTYTDTSNLDATNKAEAADFAVLADAVADVVSAVTVHAANKTVTLTLTDAVTAGQVVTVGYVPQATGLESTRDAAGNKAAALVAQAVTNQTA